MNISFRMAMVDHHRFLMGAPVKIFRMWFWKKIFVTVDQTEAEIFYQEGEGWKAQLNNPIKK